jgi:flavin reductase (DIM6/NTAB) family NADH-FMN oxidoreductase RutF
MFFEPAKNDHGLPYSPYQACVVPRPIGWISTVDRSGKVNLAPFSQFNTLGAPYVMFSAGHQEFADRRKDSVINIEATGEFVFNMATYDLREAVVLSGKITDPQVDEMAAAGLTPAPSRLVKPPRVAESPIHFECTHYDTIVLPDNVQGSSNYVVIGRAVGIHISDDVITADGRVDLTSIRPLARLGYNDYASVDHVFEIAAHADLPGPLKERFGDKAG